jgi:hypothetical protein
MRSTLAAGSSRPVGAAGPARHRCAANTYEAETLTLAAGMLQVDRLTGIKPLGPPHCKEGACRPWGRKEPAGRGEEDLVGLTGPGAAALGYGATACRWGARLRRGGVARARFHPGRKGWGAMDACGDVGPTHVVGGCVRPMLCIQRQRMRRL